MASEINFKHEDDGKKGRFAIYENNTYAGEISYTWAGDDKFIIDHTEVLQEFGGKSYGKKLVMKTIEFARENNHKILPLCPYAKKVMDGDESTNDVRF